MGIDIQLQDEDGVPSESHGDPHMLLPRFLRSQDLSATACLQFIDPYGDTTFNRLQIPALLSEIHSIRGLADDATRDYLDTIVLICNRALAEPHQYVKFIGD